MHEISIAKYSCLKNAQQNESKAVYTKQYRNLNKPIYQPDYDEQLVNSLLQGSTGSEARNSDRVTNERLFSYCMNAHGIYLKYK